MPRTLLALLVTLLFPIPLGFSALYICPQPDGTELFTDGEGPGCRPLQVQPTKAVPRATQPVPVPLGKQLPIAKAMASAKAKSVPKPAEPTEVPLHRRFDTITVQYPALNYYGGSGSNYVPKAGEVTREEISVRYLADGQGPRVVSIAQFDGNAHRGLEEAIHAASAAVGYDPAYLDIYYDPVPHLKYMQDQLIALPPDLRPLIKGDSASAMWSIVIAAGLLGDTLRPEVCMTGAIQPEFRIGFVGKVDQKIYGCAKSGYREMVVPLGQKDITLVGNALSLGLTITEVGSLAEAYEAVTGKSLRLLTR